MPKRHAGNFFFKNSLSGLFFYALKVSLNHGEVSHDTQL